MLPRICGQKTATRRSLQKALLNKVGFDNVFDCVARFGKRCRNGFNSDRPASEISRNLVEITPVKFIKTDGINFKP